MALHVDSTDIALLVAVAFAAGWLDAVVGGGGLVQVPVLMLVLPQLPVATVLGTNKLVAITGTSGAAVTYASKVGLDRPRAAVAAAVGLPTAVLGAGTASMLPRDTILAVVAVTLVAVGVWAVRVRPGPTPGTGAAHGHRPSTPLLVTGAAGVGYYSGVVGSGTGVILIALFVSLLNTDFLRGSAMAKTVSIGSDLGALVLFGLLGHVLWLLGGAMAAANVAGGIVGARTALARGAGFVRAALLLVVVVLVVKLAYDQWHTG